MSLPVLRIENRTVKLINFKEFDPDGKVTIKYGFGALVLDSKPPQNRIQNYVVQMHNYTIDDEFGVALIKRNCKSRNNAFIFVRNQFYVHNTNIDLPDNFTPALDE